MRQFLAVVAFSLLTIGFFAAYSNFGIPQLEPAPPPVEEESPYPQRLADADAERRAAPVLRRRDEEWIDGAGQLGMPVGME